MERVCSTSGFTDGGDKGRSGDAGETGVAGVESAAGSLVLRPRPGFKALVGTDGTGGAGAGDDVEAA